jgi:uncharacterized protein
LKLHALRATQLNTVTAYGPGYIEINGARHTGNLILLPASVQHWNVAGFECLRPEDFDPVLSLKPELVLLGTGLRQRLAPPRLTASLARAGIALEAMDTKAACRTYNILVSDGRQVAGALFQEETQP